MSGGSKIRQSVWFTGRVQGVGFRYTALSVAREFAVTGYVKNLPDGRVEAVIEGDPPDIDRYLAALREAMAGCIRHEESRESPATGSFHGFEIRY